MDFRKPMLLLHFPYLGPIVFWSLERKGTVQSLFSKLPDKKFWKLKLSVSLLLQNFCRQPQNKTANQKHPTYILSILIEYSVFGQGVGSGGGWKGSNTWNQSDLGTAEGQSPSRAAEGVTAVPQRSLSAPASPPLCSHSDLCPHFSSEPLNYSLLKGPSSSWSTVMLFLCGFPEPSIAPCC